MLRTTQDICKLSNLWNPQKRKLLLALTANLKIISGVRLIFTKNVNENILTLNSSVHHKQKTNRPYFPCTCAIVPGGLFSQNTIPLAARGYGR